MGTDSPTVSTMEQKVALANFLTIACRQSNSVPVLFTLASSTALEWARSRQNGARQPTLCTTRGLVRLCRRDSDPHAALVGDAAHCSLLKPLLHRLFQAQALPRLPRRDKGRLAQSGARCRNHLAVARRFLRRQRRADALAHGSSHAK